MVRDPLRDETYFKTYLESENDSIDEFKDLLKVVIAERGVEDEGVIRTYGMEDALIDFLLSSRGLASSESNSPLLHVDPYQHLFNLIYLDDHKQQIQKLQEYLEFHWYDGHEDTGWHDSHHHWDAIYTGYWSYESGAVAKILGLDDEGLKGFPYYPYDLVHYQVRIRKGE